MIPAGGAGTRLWPRSRKASPKHVLPLSGSGKPLLRETYERIRPLAGEVIVLTDTVLGATPDAVKARPGWAGISAVRDGRIVAIDSSLASRPGPRVFDALEQLARAFHPELFR